MMPALRRSILTILGAAALCLAPQHSGFAQEPPIQTNPAQATAPAPPLQKPPQKAAPRAVPGIIVPGSIVGLQKDRVAQKIALADGSSLTLVNLAPRVGAWYLLEVAPAAALATTYHLQAVDPERTTLELLEKDGGTLRITKAGRRSECRPWAAAAGGAGSSAIGGSELAQARAAGLPFAPLCGDQLYLRITTSGRRSSLERFTDLLRDRVKGGEAVTTFVKDTVFKDRYVQTGDASRTGAGASTAPRPENPDAPPSVAIFPKFADATVPPAGLALALDQVIGGRLDVGRWYPATGVPGVYVSALQPGQVPGVPPAFKSLVSPLDEVESVALAYLVAFDLTELRLGFVLGTDHPRLGWSERVPPSVLNPAVAGPDGFGENLPLARTGVLEPHLAGRVAATFTGGFKRTHGAFKFGALATQNSGSHYGFVEQGTIFSRLQPGLATLVVWKDGATEMLTWRKELDASPRQIVFARQNGAPLVEADPETSAPRPGSLVSKWGEGNWSGSEDKKQRTLRAGMCLVDAGERRYLLYGYFSAATPSAMARTFLAAGCSYALHLDMNALEHSYLALYRLSGQSFLTEHLIDGMSVLDPEKGGSQLPRFVAVPDNRDFFYLLRRGGNAP